MESHSSPDTAADQSFYQRILAPLLIIAVGWIFWLYRLGVNDLNDAISNELAFSRESVSTILFDMKWADQSPLFMLLLHFWGFLGNSPFVVGSLNLIIYSLAVICLHRFTRSTFRSDRVAHVAALFAVFSPVSLWVVREGRMYGLLLLVSILSLHFLSRLRDGGRPRYVLLLILSCGLNIYNHFLGFMISGIVVSYLFADAGLRAWSHSRGDRDVGVFMRSLRVPCFVLLGITFFTFPQIVRFMDLMSAPPLSSSQWALPSLSVSFADRVNWFCFINSKWGLLEPWASGLRLAYLNAIHVLCLLGLLFAPRWVRWLGFLWILIPLYALGIAASILDVRDRYFIFALPLVWAALANGAVGRFSLQHYPTIVRQLLLGARVVSFAVVATGSFWLLCNKLPERYAEWTNVLTGVEQLYRPTMSLYLLPYGLEGITANVARTGNLNPALAEGLLLSRATRAHFLREVADGKDFVFLVHWWYEDPELDWRRAHLTERGYFQTRLRGHNANAEIFSREEIQRFTHSDRLDSYDSRDDLLKWIRQRLRDRRTRDPNSRLASALVARVSDDAQIRESVFYTDQRGESGYWRTGPREWEAVHEDRLRVGGIEKRMIFAHPENDSVLAVAFPDVSLSDRLRVTYGIADSGAFFSEGADVQLEVYVNNRRLAELSRPNISGWEDVILDTTHHQGKLVDLTFLVTSTDDRYRHFVFDFEPSPWLSHSWPPFAGPHNDPKQARSNRADGARKLDRADKEYLISVARSALTDSFSGKLAPQNWPQRFEGEETTVFASLRVEGRKRGSRGATSTNLANAVYQAAASSLRDERYGDTFDEKEPQGAQLELFVLGVAKPFDSNFELGIHGLLIESGDRSALYYNSVPIEHNWSLAETQANLCLKAQLPRDCFSDRAVRKSYFSTTHFASPRFADEVVTFYRANTLEFPPSVTNVKLETRLEVATEWFLGRLSEEGRFLYEYAPAIDAESQGDRLLRQLMAARLLAELSRDRPELQPAHRDNLDYVLEHWYRDDGDQGYVLFADQSELGANAMALRLLAASPFFSEYEPIAHKLARGILAAQRPDGSFAAYRKRGPTSANEDLALLFFSGEAILSLTELHERSGRGREYLDAAIRSQEHYLAKYLAFTGDAFEPALIPWQTLALSHLYQLTQDRRYADGIFRFNDQLVMAQNQHGVPYLDHLGHFHHPRWGYSNSASTAVYTEGLAYAFELATKLQDHERRDRYGRAILCAIQNLLNLQFHDENMYYLARPDLARGGIRNSVQDNRMRIDNTQHTIDALLKIREVFVEDDIARATELVRIGFGGRLP